MLLKIKVISYHLYFTILVFIITLCFFKKLVDRKNDKVNFDIIPKTIEEYISEPYGCIRFRDSYRFLSSSLDSTVKTSVDNSHKTLNDLKEKIVDSDEILKFVFEIKILFKEDRYENDCIKDLKEDYPEEIIKLEEVLLNYMVKTILNF